MCRSLKPSVKVPIALEPRTEQNAMDFEAERLAAHGGRYFAADRLSVADLKVFVWIRHLRKARFDTMGHQSHRQGWLRDEPSPPMPAALNSANR